MTVYTFLLLLLMAVQPYKIKFSYIEKTEKKVNFALFDCQVGQMLWPPELEARRLKEEVGVGDH